MICSHGISSLLIMPLLGPQACESILYLLYFHLADDACPWLTSLWVAILSCPVSTVLIVPVLGSLVCEWLPCHACISTLLITPVLNSLVGEWLPCLTISSWLMLLVFGYHSLWVAKVHCYISSLLHACPWSSSLWVTAIAHLVSSLLTMSVLDSSDSEWSLWLAAFQACWWHLSWLFSLWVLLWLALFQAFW